MVRGMKRFVPVLLVALAGTVALVPSAAAQRQNRIIGGAPAAIESYPYQVRITNSTGGVLESSCGGVIRDATHVMTAAHCVTDQILGTANPPGAITIHYENADTNSQRSVGVTSVNPAPKYVTDRNYDAALLTLSAPLEGFGGPRVNRIPFAGAGEVAAAVAAGQTAVATGWGLTSNGGTTTNQLRAVSLPLRPDDVCSARYGSAFSPPLGVCAGGAGTAPENNPDTCNGDSGGPLAVAIDGKLKLVGLTSFGDECGLPNTPGVYTETSNAEICSVLGGGQECLTNPRPPDPPPVTTVRDTTRPSARITSVRCKRRRCGFRVRTADPGGTVRALTARVYRRVRICRIRDGRRICRTVIRSKKLRTKKIPGGYSATTLLNVARYRLDAVATDAAGNRSKVARMRFRVTTR